MQKVGRLQICAEHPVLLTEVVEDLLLLPVEPAREGRDEEDVRRESALHGAGG